MPTTEQLVTVLRDEFNLNVTSDNEIEIDIEEVLRKSVSPEDIDIILPRIINQEAYATILEVFDIAQLK